MEEKPEEVSKPLYFLHVLILFGIVSIPVWPRKYLRYGVYIPLVITLMWVVFGACPLTDADPAVDHFTHHFVSNFVDGVSVKTVDHAVIFIMVFVTFAGMYRLCQCPNETKRRKRS